MSAKVLFCIEIAERDISQGSYLHIYLGMDHVEVNYG